MIANGSPYALNYIWDTGLLRWIPQTAGTAGGGIVDQGAGGNSPWLIFGPLLGDPWRADSNERVSADATHDDFNFYLGGLGGTLQATITVGYSDATKTVWTSIVRSF